jgi:hypothetical protein
MNRITQNLIDEYIDKNMASFFEKQIELLSTVEFSDLMGTMHPYRPLINFPLSASSIVSVLLDTYISSSEETLFEDLFEGLAIFINGKVYSGWKSGIKGIDLEFDNNGIRYIVSIKSGPNWGNSSQIEKMVNTFNTAKKTLQTSNSHLNIMCINGCCYGKYNNPDKGSYYKYCGQAFWEFIGGNENIYTDIIEPLGRHIKITNKKYFESYARMINKFTKEFLDLFCDDNGSLDWNKLVKFNSGKK